MATEGAVIPLELLDGITVKADVWSLGRCAPSGMGLIRWEMVIDLGVQMYFYVDLEADELLNAQLSAGGKQEVMATLKYMTPEPARSGCVRIVSVRFKSDGYGTIRAVHESLHD